MIDRNEIDSMADALEVRPADVQRDYVNGWLLVGIFRSPQLAERLVLKGGNALRKAYFENTRYSKDLDFSTAGSIDKDMLRAEMAQACAFVTEQTGVEFLSDKLVVLDKTRVSKELEVVDVRAYFRDFYGESRGLPLRVFLDVNQYERLFLEPATRRLLHPYSDAAACSGATIRCVALEEILASKLKCLLQRQHASDLFDYLRWLMFGDVPIDHLKVLQTFLRKTIYHRAPGAAFELLSHLPVAIFKGLWERYVVSPASCRIAFDDAVAQFKTHLSDLFGSERSRYSRRLSFFPSALRDPIMSAGRAQNRMRLLYDGSERVIEPYALKFKTTKDDDGGEYFYAWNCSGGSGEGLRTFVPEKVQHLEELPERFEPRFEIEISKAGDMHDKPHFTGRKRPTSFIPGFGITRSRKATSGPKHVFRCPACGKTFRREKYDADIRGHKGRAGIPCGAWYATYIGFRQH